MSLDNIDDIFSEQPLKNPSKIDNQTADEDDIKSLKKNLIKKQLEKSLAEQKFSIRKFFRFFSKLEMKYYLNLLKISIILFLFVVSYFMITYAISSYKGLSKDIIKIEQHKSFVNNANFLYLDKDFIIDDTPNNLLKMKIDTLATQFYFDREIDIDVFTPVLIDEKGDMYYYDSNYIKEENVDEFVVVFSGLAPGIKNFTLLFTKDIHNPKEDFNTVFFEFNLEEENILTPVKYFTEDFSIIKNTNGRKFEVQIQNATFSSAVSDVVVSIYYDSEEVEYDFSPETLAKTIYLKDGVRNVTFRDNSLKTSEIDVSDFNKTYDDIKLSKVSFGILKNLNTNLIIGVQNFYRVFRPDFTVDTKNLLFNKNEYSQSLKLDEYTVNFERVLKYDDENIVVLVAHATEDIQVSEVSEVPLESNDNDDYATDEVGRIVDGENLEEEIPPVVQELNPFREIIVDATLTLNLPDGSVEVIQGKPNHFLEGTDIIFESENIKLVNSSNMELVVNKITVIEEGGERAVNLKEVDNKMKPEHLEYIRFTEAALLDRLKYKVREKVFLDLEKSFVPSILNDEEFLERYEPIVFEKRPSVLTEVSSYAFDNEGNFIAIVNEELVGTREGWNIHIKNKHEVVVADVYGELKVVRDRIIN